MARKHACAEDELELLGGRVCRRRLELEEELRVIKRRTSEIRDRARKPPGKMPACTDQERR